MRMPFCWGVRIGNTLAGYCVSYVVDRHFLIYWGKCHLANKFFYERKANIPNITSAPSLNRTNFAPKPKTVNPLDPQRHFCQYCLREGNLTADFWICISWHPQISQSESWDHYQPISFWIRWISQRQCVWKQTQPLKLSKLPRCGSKGLTVFDPSPISLSAGTLHSWLILGCRT